MKTRFVAMGLLMGAACVAQAAADAGKNCYDVLYAGLPADFAKTLKDAPEEWNFNFRPYGTSSEWLWSDSNVRRAASADEALSDRNVTGLRVSCDADGFTALIFCNEPTLATYLAQTNDYPHPSIEFFVAPGDADLPGVQQRYMAYYGDGVCREYENREPDRDFRLGQPEVTELELKNSIVVKIHWEWKNFWMRLPVFCRRADNFWRLSIIRWVGPGVTWGGTVHQNSQAGYIRWPSFTEEQKTAILKRTLENGWREYRAFMADNRNSLKKVSMEPSSLEKFRAEALVRDPRSFVNLNEDPDFRATFQSMAAARDALAADIARMSGMSPEERDAFYLKAAPMLFNFAWDVQSAHAKLIEDKLFAK